MALAISAQSKLTVVPGDGQTEDRLVGGWGGGALTLTMTESDFEPALFEQVMV